MEKKRFFIYCCGGLGREIASTVAKINESSHEWDEIRFIVDSIEGLESHINGVEVWSLEQYLAGKHLESDRFIIANGEAVVRAELDKKLQGHGIRLGTVIHPDNYAIDPTTEIGEGVIIQGQAIPGPNCKVGRGTLLQGRCIIGHDVVIGNYCTISSLAFIGGDTEIGDGTYIAPGSLLRNGLKIGKNCIIGMGSVVTKDIPDNSVAYGNPCKVARENTSGRVFSK